MARLRFVEILYPLLKLAVLANLQRRKFGQSGLQRGAKLRIAV
jgi:hypothetical protein